MKMLTLFFVLSLSCFSAQNLKITDQKLQQSILFLDQAMQTNSLDITKVLDAEVSFGHSNGWIQNYSDFIKDFKANKVKYQQVNQTQLKEFKKNKNTVSIRRVVFVKGLYNNSEFEMSLSLLEIWIKKHHKWKLWSRQSIELKP